MDTTAVVGGIRARLRGRSRPLVVAIDGRSGTGKSSLAALVADAVGAVIVPTDDFYAASIPDVEWESRTPAERAADVIDWRRLRADAVEPLRAGHEATWYPFDFEAGPRSDGTFPGATIPVTRLPAPVVVLDGAYSSRPELADLIDLSVLVDLPRDERHRRLVARDGEAYSERWHARWDEAEDHYFGKVRPASSFDFVVRNPSPREAP